jgi:antitoxin PrlF
MHSTIAERGQITVPKSVRDALGLRPGDRLVITLEEGGFHARKEQVVDPIDSVRGIITEWGSTEEAMGSLRGRGPHDDDLVRP